MTIEQKGNTIFTFQGDSGEIFFSGFNPEKNYYVYFAIRDEDGNPIGDELRTTTNGSDTARIFLDADMTDMLTVLPDEDYAIYYYGLKKTEINTNEEDTVVPNMGGKAVLIVYKKVVEGPK